MCEADPWLVLVIPKPQDQSLPLVVLVHLFSSGRACMRKFMCEGKREMRKGGGGFKKIRFQWQTLATLPRSFKLTTFHLMYAMTSPTLPSLECTVQLE